VYPYRSILFVPGHKPEWAIKALNSGADAIVLDLEDSVAPSHKAAARESIRDLLPTLREMSPKIGIFVRPNALETGLSGADLEVVVRGELTGIFPPKIRGASDVIRWEALLDWFETRNHASGLKMIVPVETVDAIHNCLEIAGASPRVAAMTGPTSEHADIARAVGFRQSPEGSETLYLRSRVLLACRQYGLHPITAIWEDLNDLEGLHRFADYALQLGYRGQIVIHPKHVPEVNKVFSPSATDIAYYEALVTAMDEAARSGDGAVRFRGQHIDIAHADKARQWLDRARIIAETP